MQNTRSESKRSIKQNLNRRTKYTEAEETVIIATPIQVVFLEDLEFSRQRNPRNKVRGSRPVIAPEITNKSRAHRKEEGSDAPPCRAVYAVVLFLCSVRF